MAGKTIFGRALAHAARTSSSSRRGRRRWVFVPYDQLTADVGPLAREAPEELGIVLVECPAKAERRPYHRQKLALVLTNLRHFALEQAARGVAVRHEVADSYAAALARVIPEIASGESGAVRMMRPAERELRAELAPLVAKGMLEEVPHEGWLTTAQDFAESQGHEPPWRMDAFYKHVRRRHDILMVRGKPEGGRFSFDTENRQRWRGSPPAPAPPAFAVDEVTREVCDLVTTRFASHPGVLTPETLPATREDAERLWAFAQQSCLPAFGPFEDAMSTASRTLFHTRISPLLNLMRLVAPRVVSDVVAMKDLPLPSREGFIRQILGWREYVRHVHEATDGFRVIRGERQPTSKEGASLTSFLGADRPLPPAYWGKASGLRCLDEVVRGVWEDGYSHHITRLMVLSNIAMLLDVSPRELTDWFWVAYVDAYDWVVEPNVHGMGSFGVGDLLTTKPYVAGSAYIHKMSDYCEGCRFDPKTTCPLPSLYWAFLGRHRAELGGVNRMKLPVAAESKRTAAKKNADAATFARVAEALAAGRELLPEPD
jgi:deoxyribodipyrimidine photolyase-related protein